MKSDLPPSFRAGKEAVAVVGCGFTGTLQAVNLARHGGPGATLIERRAEPARGLAYSTLHPGHLLNVRAARMSAFPDEPDHFVAWLKAQGKSFEAHDFVPRAVYGEYLQDLLEKALAARGSPIRLVRGTAIAIRDSGAGRKVQLESGQKIGADVAILATGNLPPRVPPGVDAVALGDLYEPDPWDFGALDDLQAGDAVLLLGTGLTMVDVALLLHARGHKGPIVALSRRGLIPHAHGPAHGHPEARTERPIGNLAGITREIRERAEEIGWQNAVDELRPMTQAIWRGLGTHGQSRFLRHLRPWWDIHRHRIAPEVARTIGEMRDSGQLTIAAGYLRSTIRNGNAATVGWAERGTGELRSLDVQRVVNCTGPLGDISRAEDLLIRHLLQEGTVRPDPLNLGLDVDQDSRTIDRNGTVNDWLYALGPATRGSFWEIVAVPDIRVQTWTVARKLSNAHWVGGEGL